MQLDLTRYRQPEEHVSRTFQPADLQEAGGEQEGDAYRIVDPVRLDFDIQKDKDKFRLVGTVKTELELSCGRCLEAFRLPVDASFDLRNLPASELAEGEEREGQDEDLDTS